MKALKKHTWTIIIGLAVVLLVGSVFYSQSISQAANEGIELTPHIKGDPGSDVVLVEYSDFQCPACAQFYPIVRDIVEVYGEDMAFEYRHFPLISIHPFAVPAAKAAEAAGQQGKFFEMHDLLFENQAAWSNSAAPQAFFVQYATELELDVDLFKRHMRASLINDQINEQFAEARAQGFSGTPSFLLNGQRMQFQTFEEFRAQIEAAIGIEIEVGSSTDAAGDSTSSTTPQPAAQPAVRFGI